jgi:predicted transcriptional regulator
MIKFDDIDGVSELFLEIMNLITESDLAIVDLLGAVSQAQGYVLAVAIEENIRRHAGLTDDEVRDFVVANGHAGALTCHEQYAEKDAECQKTMS